MVMVKMMVKMKMATIGRRTTHQRSGLTFWCRRIMLKPRSLAAWRSKVSAASDGAAYSPSGQKLWSSHLRSVIGMSQH
jgi:hypothetical protein